VKPITENTLFYGDNLPIMQQYIPDESVDLVYLDPPFNSNRTYNVLFKQESGKDSEAQIAAFEDTWHWNDAAEEAYDRLVMEKGGDVGEMIGALRTFIGTNQMMAYLVMMAERLVELHRVLRPTGSLYLHCDPTASHYLKILIDTVFGPDNYRNEIIWKRTSAHANVSQKFGVIHDTILFYSKTKEFTWNQQHAPYEQEYIDTFFDQLDSEGRRYARRDLTASMQRASSGQLYEWKGVRPPSSRCWAMTKERMDALDAEGRIHWPKKQGGMPRLKVYPEDLPGSPIQDIWTDIKVMHNLSDERLGYPTQKPLALLDRIIEVSSNEGDTVLDPFCGCGTAIASAQKLGRKWIGIDITHLSIALQKYRLKDMFGDSVAYQVIGEPESLEGARQLASEDRFQFQWWALSLMKARPYGGEAGSKKGKKGADGGIDGVITFIDDSSSKPKRVLVQVKSGKVSRPMISELVGTIQREDAAIGVFLTLEEPTRDMKTEAVSAGFYESPWSGKHRKIQILTVKDLLAGGKVDMPPTDVTFRAAERVREENQQPRLID
jgi:site-specific DNA-methyltransferase (adenine-specific)